MPSIAKRPDGRADEIKILHGEILEAARTSLDKAIRIGQLLLEQKESMAHGEFLPWVSANLPFSERTARNYMQVHRERDRLKSATVADLTNAYRILATKNAVFRDEQGESQKQLPVGKSQDSLQEKIERLSRLFGNHEDTSLDLKQLIWPDCANGMALPGDDALIPQSGNAMCGFYEGELRLLIEPCKGEHGRFFLTEVGEITETGQGVRGSIRTIPGKFLGYVLRDWFGVKVDALEWVEQKNQFEPLDFNRWLFGPEEAKQRTRA